MVDWVEAVKKFQDIFEKKFNDVPKLIDLRARLIHEEIHELWAGLNDVWQGTDDGDAERIKRGRIDTLDAIVDSIVVLIGTANALDMDLNEAMRRVFDSNLSKLGDDGRPFYNEHGKVMKGPNFHAPKLDDLV